MGENDADDFGSDEDGDLDNDDNIYGDEKTGGAPGGGVVSPLEATNRTNLPAENFQAIHINNLLQTCN